MKTSTDTRMEMGWFHCGRCGAFFESDHRADREAVWCPDCGKDPVTFEEGPDRRTVGLSEVDLEGELAEADTIEPRRRGRTSRSGRPRRGRHTLMYFVLGWVVLLGVVTFVATRGTDSEPVQGEGLLQRIEGDQKFLNDHFFAARQNLMAYLDAGALERQAEFVADAETTLGKMTNWTATSLAALSGDQPEADFTQVIQTPRGRALEIVWSFRGQRKVESVFYVDEDGSPRIDWPNMVRYSDQPFPLYLAGQGSDEGEFRLLARRRSGDEDGSGKVASVVLVGPRAEFPGELGASSPEIVVEPGSRVARVLEAAFDQRDRGEGAYGSLAPTLDPKRMIRVRVRLTREGDQDRTFRIREIIACHWYDIDDLGLGN